VQQPQSIIGYDTNSVDTRNQPRYLSKGIITAAVER